MSCVKGHTCCASDGDREVYDTDLSERELFSAMAMQGFLSNSSRSLAPDTAAKEAVEFADALIAELKKEEKE
jgi:hypothetical protein